MPDYPDEEHVVKIIDVQNVTHNVKRFTLSRPDNYHFMTGQAKDIVINQPDWLKERRPFTFTGLNEWDKLEFTIKIYQDHKGVTNQLGQLKVGDELIIHDVFGAINYKGEGTFIAGGAGVTPFIAIFRQLNKEDKDSHYQNGIVNEDFLKSNIKNLDQYFYVCGPDSMIESIAGILEKMGVDKERVIREEF